MLTQSGNKTHCWLFKESSSHLILASLPETSLLLPVLVVVQLGCSEDWSVYCQLFLTECCSSLSYCFCLWVPPPPVLNLLYLLYIFRGRKEEGKGWKFPVGVLTLRLTQQLVSSHSAKYWLVPKSHPSRKSVFVDFMVDSNMLSTSRTRRMHQYYLASRGTDKSFYICSNGSSDK